ncbi:MAG TPA: alpha/beta hydrolase [Oculatellaceae cyanobacterium]|jgi:sigma-B regulation protein RsbQ
MVSNIILRNNVTCFGRGKQPMLFAHGFGCDQNMWRFLTPNFENDYKIFLFDYVGSGKSDLSAYSAERYSNLNGYVQDVVDICEALDLTDVIFVGHSVSSIIGILASLQVPHRFAHLILIAPSPCYINDLPDYLGGFERTDIEGLLDIMERNYMGWASLLAPIVMKNEEHPELTNELETSFCSTDPVIARRFAEVTFLSDNRHDLPKVTVPSLILQCSDDALAPIEVGHYLHRHLLGSTLQVMKATGHCPHMSHPQETLHLIKQYLETVYATCVF